MKVGFALILGVLMSSSIGWADTGEYISGFSLTGAQGVSPEVKFKDVQVDGNVIKIKITATEAATIQTGDSTQSNFKASYNCVSYMIRVGAKEVRTPVLAVNGGGPFCPGAPSSVEISIPVTSSKSNIVISDPLYDFYNQICLSQMIPAQNPVCINGKLTPVYRTHVVTGKIDIENKHYGSAAQGSADPIQSIQAGSSR